MQALKPGNSEVFFNAGFVSTNPETRSPGHGGIESVREGVLVGEFDPVALGAGNIGPIDAELARLFCGADIFRALEANGVDERVGHVGERDGATEGDAVLAGEFREPGDGGADRHWGIGRDKFGQQISLGSRHPPKRNYFRVADHPGVIARPKIPRLVTSTDNSFPPLAILWITC